MKVILYNSKAEKNRVDKGGYLSHIVDLDGTLRSGTSLVNPAIILELHEDKISKLMTTSVVDDSGRDVIDDDGYDVVASYINKVLTANYAYIPDFNRYYFITDITAVGRNLWMISMSVDVLMSYYDDIMDLSAFIARNQYDYDSFVVDDLANFKYNKDITTFTPADKSDVTQLSTTPPTSWHTAVMAYLTDDTVRFSSSTPSLAFLPRISAYASGSNISTQYLVGTTGMIYDLAKTVYKNDTLLSFVKTVMIYPFDIPSIQDDNVTQIKIGTTEYTLTDKFRYPSHYPERIVVADFDMPNATSFLDYSPYKTYEIYIPYCGFVTLSGESILGKNLEVFYLVNWEDGTANAFIYNVSDDIILYSAQCVLGVKVALSSSNALELSNQKTALALNTGINLIGSALTIGGGFASGNPLAIGGGILKGTSTLGNAISSFNQMYDMGKVGMTSPSVGLSSRQNVFMRITSTNPVGYDADYFSLKGRPLNQYRKLSTLSGFTVVNDVHIEYIPNATLTEVNDIERLLTSGVIL